MGAIQNTINAALGGVAKATTAGVGIGALKADEAAKAIQNRANIEDAAKREIEDLSAADLAAKTARKDVKAAKENLEYTKNNEVIYLGSDPDKQYEAELENRENLMNAEYRLSQANSKYKELQQVRKEQKALFEKRKEIITARAEAFNKTARRNKLEKINVEELFKGGKK